MKRKKKKNEEWKTIIKWNQIKRKTNENAIKNEKEGMVKKKEWSKMKRMKNEKEIKNEKGKKNDARWKERRSEKRTKKNENWSQIKRKKKELKHERQLKK